MEIEASNGKRLLTNESTISLLQQIKITIGGEEERILIEELYFRFAPRFYKICKTVCEQNGYSQDFIDEIFQSVMSDGVYKLKKFEHAETDPEEIVNRKVLGWLSKKARYQIKDHQILQAKLEVFEHNEDEIDIADDNCEFSHQSSQLSKDDINREKLRDALLMLNDRERLIFNICALHDCLDSGRHMPDTELGKICEKLGIKKANFRQIKLRALKKIHNILKQ